MHTPECTENSLRHSSCNNQTSPRGGKNDTGLAFLLSLYIGLEGVLVLLLHKCKKQLKLKKEVGMVVQKVCIQECELG